MIRHARLIIFVPVFVQRPIVAIRTGRPLPLMRAARAFSAGGKGVPQRAAAAEERFRGALAVAGPHAQGCRLPFAQRAADPFEALVVIIVVVSAVLTRLVFNLKSALDGRGPL